MGPDNPLASVLQALRAPPPKSKPSDVLTEQTAAMPPVDVFVGPKKPETAAEIAAQEAQLAGPKSTKKGKLAKKKEGEAVASKESSGKSSAEAKPKAKPEAEKDRRQDRDQQRRLNTRPRHLLRVLSAVVARTRCGTSVSDAHVHEQGRQMVIASTCVARPRRRMFQPACDSTQQLKADFIFARGALRTLRRTKPIAQNPTRVFPAIFDELADPLRRLHPRLSRTASG